MAGGSASQVRMGSCACVVCLTGNWLRRLQSMTVVRAHWLLGRIASDWRRAVMTNWCTYGVSIRSTVNWPVLALPGRVLNWRSWPSNLPCVACLVGGRSLPERHTGPFYCDTVWGEYSGDSVSGENSRRAAG